MGLPIGDCRLSIDSSAIQWNAFSIGNRQSSIDNRSGRRRLGGRGRKRMGLHFRLEINLAVRTVAEGLIRRMATTAKPHGSSPTQVKWVALCVVDCEFPFNPQ
jgi:hypothetical protein